MFTSGFVVKGCCKVQNRKMDFLDKDAMETLHKVFIFHFNKQKIKKHEIITVFMIKTTFLSRRENVFVLFFAFCIFQIFVNLWDAHVSYEHRRI